LLVHSVDAREHRLRMIEDGPTGCRQFGRTGPAPTVEERDSGGSFELPDLLADR
jgi:hypothetical protein